MTLAPRTSPDFMGPVGSGNSAERQEAQRSALPLAIRSGDCGRQPRLSVPPFDAPCREHNLHRNALDQLFIDLGVELAVAPTVCIDEQPPAKARGIEFSVARSEESIGAPHQDRKIVR